MILGRHLRALNNNSAADIRKAAELFKPTGAVGRGPADLWDHPSLGTTVATWPSPSRCHFFLFFEYNASLTVARNKLVFPIPRFFH